MTTNNSNIALLIDGDNVSYRYIAGLLIEVANYGTANVRRIYGDWTEPSLKGWKECLLKHSITPIQQFAYTTGKNATDGAMIIDAMDLLYTGRFSSFCIVSSDSDFTRLASRIREQGVTVYGFGERKTNAAFMAACNKFTYFDALSLEPGELLDLPRPPPPQPRLQPQPQPDISPILARDRPNKRPLDQAAFTGIVTAVKNISNHSDDWVNLADIGNHLTRLSPDLGARNYGYGRLREFLEASGMVDFKLRNMGDKPPVVLVRLKDNLA